MTERSIDDILSDEPAEAIEPEVHEEAEPETAERPRGPDGKFIRKDETGVETPTAEEAAEPVPPTEQSDRLPRDVYEPLKAIRNENQELKARLAAIEAMQTRQQPQPPPVDFWDDPQTFMDSRLNQLGEQLLQQWEQKQQIQRLNASEEAAKARHADYNEAYVAFEQAVQLNPRLAYELAQAPDPGEFAYQRGKTALEIQRVGSIDELRAQVRAELEAEARATIQPRLPSTTAADGSVGARTGPDWSGPTPLTEIIG